MKSHWTRPSTGLVVLLGAFMGGNTIRALLDPVDFALAALVMPIGDAILVASHEAPSLIVVRHAATAVLVAITAGLLFQRARQEVNS